MNSPSINPDRRTLAAPSKNAETESFYQATNEGILQLGKCGDCDHFHFYPRALCPFCFSPHTRRIPAIGKGTIFAYSVMRKGVTVPYAVAYVTLTEGVTILTNLVDCDLDKLRIGQPVNLVFQRAEDGTAIPVFTPS
jgi:uncharacterized OB-fold protein